MSAQGNALGDESNEWRSPKGAALNQLGRTHESNRAAPLGLSTLSNQFLGRCPRLTWGWPVGPESQSTIENYNHPTVNHHV